MTTRILTSCAVLFFGWLICSEAQMQQPDGSRPAVAASDNEPTFRGLERAAAAADVRTDAYGGASYGLVVNPKQRELSRVFFATVYQASKRVPSGWTGNVAQGVAGTTSPAFQNAVVLRINYFRAMAGVPAAVTLANDLSADDQQAALMISANNSENGYPPSTWIDYTADGAYADANSDRDLGINGPLAITDYVRGEGTGDTSVGTRREVLYPPTTVMGTGDIDGSPDGAFSPANALWTLDKNAYAHPEPVARDGFVAWPPPGFVPYQLVFRRWSFSYRGADFGSATVSMLSAGQSTPVQLAPVVGGYGDNTLVWIPEGLTAAAPAGGNLTYHVKVANVLIKGAPHTFTYQVTAFDPEVPGSDQVLPVLSGLLEIPVGQPSAYEFNSVPHATSYQWTARTLSPLVLFDHADNGVDGLTISPTGANVLAADPGNGITAYNLLSYPAESITLNSIVVPAAGSFLLFSSDLGFATGDETAQVQISTDGGDSWQTVFAQTGTDGVSAGRFMAQSIDLSQFAGQACQLRFACSLGGGGSFFEGWFVNNITVSGAQTLGAGVPTAITRGLGCTFTPPSAGAYALQVTPLFFGSYPADAGPLKIVTAVPR